MRGLFVKDFELLLVQKKFYGMVLVVGIILNFMTGNFFASSYIMMFCAMFVTTTVSYDEFENGYGFLMTLPIQRKDYVKEKYLFGLITGFGAWVLGLAMEMVCILIQKSETKISELLGTSLLMWSVGLAMIAVMLPFFLKFGPEKGRNIVFAALGGIVGSLYVVTRISSRYGFDLSGIFDGVLNSKIITISLLVFFGILFLYMISCRISMGIMEKKEF